MSSGGWYRLACSKCRKRYALYTLPEFRQKPYNVRFVRAVGTTAAVVECLNCGHTWTSRSKNARAFSNRTLDPN